LQAENEKLLVQAREERSQMLKEAKDTRDRIVNEAKDMAKAEANKIIVDAQHQIQQQKMTALTEVKNEIGNLAVEVAEKILRQQLASNDGQTNYIKMLSEDIKLN
jgi:F-type H+-transporting ATPase subunit b